MKEELNKLTLEIIKKINITNKKSVIETTFESEYDSIKFEGFKKSFSYDYEVEYPFSILKINNKIENKITIEYLHTIPRRIYTGEVVEYKDLIELIAKLKHKTKRDDLIEILKYLKVELFTAHQPEVSEDGKFIKLRFHKNELTVKLDIKAIFYSTDGWDYSSGDAGSFVSID